MAVGLKGIVDGELATDNVETAAGIGVPVPQPHLHRGRGKESVRERERLREILHYSSLPRGTLPQMDVVQFPYWPFLDSRTDPGKPPRNSQRYLPKVPSHSEREGRHQRTGTDEVADAAFLPLEQVPSLPAAEIEDRDLRLDVRANEHTLHPVVEVPHEENGALREREGGV